MKGKGFNVNKIYKEGTNRELTPEELVEFLEPIKRRSCPNCNTGILRRLPVDVSYLIKDKFFVTIYTSSEGRMEAIKSPISKYIWGCQDCTYSETEMVKNEQKRKSPTISN